MQREIKFRAWDKRINKMRTVWSVDFRVGTPMIQFPNDSMPTLETEWGNTKEHIVLMQFTGLKDKNGREIYEKMELDGKYIVDWKDGKYILIDISTGDIIPLNFKWRDYEITREYTEVQENSKRCIDKHV